MTEPRISDRIGLDGREIPDGPRSADRAGPDRPGIARVRLHFWSATEGDTLRFSEALGRALAPPLWLGLVGPLGAGKTRVIQGLALGLGYRGRVRSPTFVLEHRYSGHVPILHLDLYRLESAPEDLESSWLDPPPESRAAVLVEWAERVREPPPDALWIRIEPWCAHGRDGRRILLDWPAASGRVRDFPISRALPQASGALDLPATARLLRAAPPALDLQSGGS